MSRRNTHGGKITFGGKITPFVDVETECRSALCGDRPREIIVRPSANSVHVIPNNSHRRQIDARTSRASLSSKPINLRQFRERNGRELREVIANLHAGRNLERDTPRFGRGNGKVTTYGSKWTC